MNSKVKGDRKRLIEVLKERRSGSWAPYVKRLTAAVEHWDERDPDSFKPILELVEEGYRAVLFYREHSGIQPISSESDWEALPDRSFEEGFRRFGLRE